MADPRVVIPSVGARGDRDVGAKADTLAALAARGHAVPPFFVVSSTAFEHLRADAAVSKNIDRWDRDGRDAAEIRRAIGAARIPEAAWGEISAAYAALGGGCVAVRSSAIGEDGAIRSFAGQFDSVLSVEGEAALADAIRAVWASAYGDRAIAYRRVHGVEAVGGMAVIVQRMVQADTAGVLFTADSAGGDRMVVSATRGLADALVRGAADGVTYYVDRGTLAPSPASARDGLLPFDVLRQLGRLGRRLERELGAPQDVEWARAGSTLYVLQSRPITAPAAGRRTIWDNSNIVESYPGITLPLTFSLARESYAAVYRQAAELAGVPRAMVEAHDGELQRMIGLVRGRVYYDLGSWYALLSLLPGFEHTRADMDQMMGVRATASWDRPRRRTMSIRTVPLVARMTFLGLTIATRVRAFGAMVDGVCAEYDAVDLRRMDAAGLVDRYEDLKRRIRVEWRAPILNDFLTMLFFGLLRRLIARYGLDPTAAGMHNDLLRGIGGVPSVEPARRIAALAQRVRDDAPLRGLLAANDDAALADRALRDDLPPLLANGVREYLERYGHRCTQELKLERPSLRDDPAPLFAAIRAFAARPDLDVRGAERADRLAGEAARARARRALAGQWPLTPRWLAFRWVLGRTRRHLRDREAMRFARGRVFGLAREVFTGLGLRLHERGTIDDPRDVFFLTVDEVCVAARGGSDEPLRQRVGERRAEFAAYASEPPLPDHFETTGAAVPAAAAQHAVVTDGRLHGLACCSGIVESRTTVVLSPESASFPRGDILVARETDPSWITVFPLAAGILIERGSLLSHSAIVARELGIPAIVGIRGLTGSVVTGDRVLMDGGTGVVRRRA